MSAVNLCPTCGSGKIELEGVLLAKDASAFCQNCGWRGRQADLVTTSLDQVLKSNIDVRDLAATDAGTAIALMVAKEYMNKLAQYASQPIGLAIIESGLVGQKDSKTLARVLRVACLAAHKATLEELEAIQKEQQNVGAGN